MVRRVEGDHRRFPASGAAASRRRLERFFGSTITISTGRVVPVRLLGEQHVVEDLGFIPSFADWVRCIRPQPWMGRAQPIHKQVDPFAALSGASTDHAPNAPSGTAVETPRRF
jgi:hypothetical protein